MRGSRRMDAGAMVRDVRLRGLLDMRVSLALRSRTADAAQGRRGGRFQGGRHRLSRKTPREVQGQMMEQELGRGVASWCPGATGVTGAAKLSGGASQETWSFDIVHPDGHIGAILRRAPPGSGASPGRAAGLDAEAVLMQLAHDGGLPSPRVMHVLQARH